VQIVDDVFDNSAIPLSTTAVARLRCLRGIDTLSALGLCAEIGEWDRFDHPDQLSSYLGISTSCACR
jgi:transposase